MQAILAFQALVESHSHTHRVSQNQPGLPGLHSEFQADLIYSFSLWRPWTGGSLGKVTGTDVSPLSLRNMALSPPGRLMHTAGPRVTWEARLSNTKAKHKNPATPRRQPLRDVRSGGRRPWSSTSHSQQGHCSKQLTCQCCIPSILSESHTQQINNGAENSI